MSEMFYVLKVFIFSAFVMALMQIKIADQSIEQRSQAWLHSSSVVQVLNKVSLGASKAITKGYHFVRGEVSSNSTASPVKSSQQVQSAFNFHHGLNIKHNLKQVTTEAEAAAEGVEEKSLKLIHSSQL